MLILHWKPIQPHRQFHAHLVLENSRPVGIERQRRKHGTICYSSTSDMGANTQFLHTKVADVLSRIHTRTTDNETARECVRIAPNVCADEKCSDRVNFSEEGYLAANPDVLAAIERGQHRSGYEHWIARGRAENRSFTPIVFDDTEYIRANPDVREAISAGVFESGYDHWIKRGLAEGRRIKLDVRDLLSKIKVEDRAKETALQSVGELPPRVLSFRGRLSFLIMSLMRRALWWYTLPLRQAAAASARKSALEIELLESLTAALEDQKKRLDCLDLANRALEFQLTDVNDRVAAGQRNLRVLAGSLAGHEELNERLTSAEQSVAILAANTDTAALAAEVRGLQVEYQRLADGLSQMAQRAAPLKVVEGLHQLVAEKEQKYYFDLGAQMRAREALAEHTENEISRISGGLTTLVARLHQTQAELSFQGNRLTTMLNEIRRRLKKTDGLTIEACEKLLDEQSHSLDNLYLIFENRFRGTREEIKERVAVYVPYIEHAKAGTLEAPVVDLGCGRGEWLELLKDRNLVGRGVDLNRAMLQLCRSFNLNVTEQDALEFLTDLQDGSVGAITSFHMFEHLPFHTVIAMTDSALRVLRPGGLLILETPNPRNVVVGSSSFYLDPTHNKPIPSEMLQFFVEARGFTNVEVLPLHSGPEANLLHESDPAAERINEYFCGPRDYAIIASRP